tara:strand:+ start:299 stop:1114 length:816 start_codon:yes stop_codon:yes gene_type:complete
MVFFIFIPLALFCVSCETFPTDQLIEDLTHSASEKRRKASYRLVDQGDQAVPPLLEAMEMGSDTLRYIGAQILGRIGSPHAEKMLLNLSHDKNLHVQKKAILALSKIHVPALIDTIEQILNTSPQPELRAAAAESIASFRDTSASESLVNALEDTAALVRQSAIASINRIWTNRSIQGVLRSMDDDDEKVRYIATQIAAIRRIETARSKLRDALYDSSPWIRIEAIRGILALSDTAAAEGLVDILKYGQGEEVTAAQEALRTLTGIEYVIE